MCQSAHTPLQESVYLQALPLGVADWAKEVYVAENGQSAGFSQSLALGSENWPNTFFFFLIKLTNRGKCK